MKKTTKNFTVGAISGAIAAAVVLAWSSGGVFADFSLRASERFGSSVAIVHGFEQCRAAHPRKDGMEGKELREQQRSLFSCFSAWSPDPQMEPTRKLEAWLPEGLNRFSSAASGISMPLGIEMVGAQEKAVARKAFREARFAQDPAGGVMLMTLLSSSQHGASPEEAAAAAAKARELLPQIKMAALRERREAGLFVREHALAAATFKLAGKGRLEEALAPSMAVKALSAYWMTQNFAEMSTMEGGHSSSKEGRSELAAFREKATAWAESEWAALVKESDALLNAKASKA